MRMRSNFGKVVLTIGAMSLSIAVPIQDQPIIFQMLTKGEEYQRLVDT
jgi:hypothetical protein